MTPSATDRLLDANRAFAQQFDRGGLAAPPATGVAVVACMDARVDVYRLLGLKEGDAHVIRNAGGVVTDEVIRSLAISQHKLGTTEVIVIGHSKCGLEGLDGEEFARQLDEDVRQSIARIKASPFIPRKDAVRGFVYEVETGGLREVA